MRLKNAIKTEKKVKNPAIFILVCAACSQPFTKADEKSMFCAGLLILS